MTLKPCPFCGSMPHQDDPRYSRVTCSNAYCTLCDRIFSIDDWNRRASGWRPIETAPRDGKRILVCAPYSNTTAQYVAYYVGGDWFVEGLQIEKPTHWQPMPELPDHIGDAN